MSRNSLEEMYARAIKTAKVKGHPEIAEDFAGWITVRYLEGKSQHQTLDQSLIDFLRLEYGSVGSRCGADAILRARRQPQGTIPGCDQSATAEALERMLASRSDFKSNDPGSSDLETQYRDPRDYLPRRLSEVWDLYASHELKLSEVAQALQVSESRASQLLSRSRLHVQRFEGLRAMKARIEEGRTAFEVAWITL